MLSLKHKICYEDPKSVKNKIKIINLLQKHETLIICHKDIKSSNLPCTESIKPVTEN